MLYWSVTDPEEGAGKLASLFFLLFLKPKRAQGFCPTPQEARKGPLSFPALFTDTSCQNQTQGIQNTILNEFLGSKNYNFWKQDPAVLCIHDIGLFVCLFVLNSDSIQSSGIT